MNIHIELVRTALQNVDIEEDGEDGEDVVIRRNCSGKMMYGATCLGFPGVRLVVDEVTT